MREADIQKSLLQKIIHEEDIAALSIEYPFDFGRRRADAICLSNGLIIGYEIKSKFDRIDRLPDQLNSYKKLFDLVYVVCDKKHYNNIIKMVGKNIGIYTYSDGLIEKSRTAKTIKSTDLTTTLDAMPIQVLRAEFKATKKSKLDACNEIKKLHSRDCIREKFKSHIIDKFSTQTETFKREASNTLTLDDLLTLKLLPPKLTT